MGSVRDSVTLGPCCAMAGPERRGPAPAARKSRGRPRPPPAPLRQPARPSRLLCPLWQRSPGGRRSRGPSRLCSAPGGAPGARGGLSLRTLCLGGSSAPWERRHSACAGQGRRGSKGDLLSSYKPMLCSGFIMLN